MHAPEACGSAVAAQDFEENSVVCYRGVRASFSPSAEKNLSVSVAGQTAGSTVLDTSRLQAEEDYYLAEADEKDLVWVPSWANFIHRHLSKNRLPPRLDIQIPVGFPTEIQGPAVWQGEQLAADPNRWVVNLDQSDIKEIEQAVESILGKWYLVFRRLWVS